MSNAFKFLGISFREFFLNIKLFVPIYLIYAAGYLLVELGVAYFVGRYPAGGWEFIALMVLGVLLQFPLWAYSALAHACAANAVLTKKKVTVWQVLDYVGNNFDDGVKVLLRLVWYVAMWPIIIFVIFGGLFAVVNTFFSAANAGYEETSGVALSGAPSGIAALAGTGLGFLGSAAFVVVIIIAITRMVRSAFWSYAFVIEDVRGKEALNKSINLVKGKWWKVAGYMFLIGILMSGPMILLLSLLEIEPESLQEAVLVSVVSLVTVPVVTLYLNQIYFRLKGKKA